MSLSAKEKNRESLSEFREIREKQERIKRRKKKQEEVEKELAEQPPLDCTLRVFHSCRHLLGDKVSVTNFLA